MPGMLIHGGSLSLSVSNYISRYGARFDTGDPVKIELLCIRRGGRWKDSQGRECGEGLLSHYRRLMKAIWPGDAWHRWTDLILSELIEASFLGIAGPASSGKSHEAAKYALCTYWAWPNETTILITTTTREMLDMRIWGEIKKYFRKARERYPHLPGNLIDSRQCLVTEERDVEGREFRNGIKGCPCKKGGQWEGLGDYIGLKNKRVILIADESQLVEAGFFDSAANLDANPIFQLIALGNPKDPTDSFGRVCEPKAGWDTHDQGTTTTVWQTRFRNGRCLRLDGLDSPNLDYPENGEPFKFMIGRRFIKSTAETYGEESWQYLSMVRAYFPRNAMDRRVITRQMCEKFHAFEEAVFADSKVTRLFGLDAAYGNVGGDRCIGGEFHFGADKDGRHVLSMIGQPILIPVSSSDGMPEDQIAAIVQRECEQRGIPPGNVFFDGTGRSSLTSSFCRLWSTAVNAIEFGGRASERPDPTKPDRMCRDLYFNFVSELWFISRIAIESDQIRGLTDELVTEGQMRTWDIVNGNKVQVEPKFKMKVRLGRSPDIYDMFVCGLEGARRLGFQIGRLGLVNRRQDNDWLRKQAERVRELAAQQQLSYAA